MKFKFCGDLDAPDWLLAEITVLSRITSVRFKLLSQQIIKHISEGTMEVRLSVCVNMVDVQYEKLEKLAAAAQLGLRDACIVN